MAEATGIEGAIQAAAREARAPAADVEELELPGLALAAVGAAARGQGEATPERAERKGGRPPGARNKRTEAWVQFILARYRSPLIALAETYSRPVEELARELCCSRLDAFREQIRAAAELLPYIHQKLPQALQIEGKGVVALTIEASPAVAELLAQGDPQGDDMVIEARVIPSDDNAAKSEG